MSSTPPANSVNIGGHEYSFISSESDFKANAQEGYFTVSRDGSSYRVTSSEMLLIVYALTQTRQSEKVERYSAISSALADLAAATSNLNKNFSLMASAFDGEYFKQGIAPDGTTGVYNTVDETKTTDNTKNMDINTRYGMLSADMVKEIIKDYVALLQAYETLDSEENKATLKDLNINLDTRPEFPLGSTSLTDFAAWLKQDSITYPNGNFEIFSKNLNSNSAENKTKLEDSLKNFFQGFGISASLTFTYTDLCKEDNTVVGVAISTTYSISAGSKTFTKNEDGQIDLENDANLTNLAFCILAHTASSGSDSSGAMLTAPGATNLKETYNNLMNKTNSSTQAMTQYSSREVSKLESVQSMVDRNISNIFDTFKQIAAGY